MAGSILILTGARGAGKSTACARTAALATARGYTCGGLLTVTGSGLERDVLDLRTGEARRLTLSSVPASGQQTAVCQGPFRFNPEVLHWGELVIAQAVPCHLLLVDELGPLEIVQGRGWVRAFDVLSAGNFVLAIAVVRPELVAQAQLRLARSATSVLTLAPDNRERLPQELFEALVEACRRPQAAAPASHWVLSS